ncbi:MAG: endonuclease Q family protein [bacterium]
MRYIADLHIHSKYSRATSSDMSPESIWKWAQLKGITVIGTGDFTHPEWFKELRKKLEPSGNGLLRLKDAYQGKDIPGSCSADVFFMLTAEISCIYSRKGKTRKVHCLVFAPDGSVAGNINTALSKIGNLSSDGRPILGLDAKELLKIVLDSSPDVILIPAHAWTPHFSVFGSESGFDSLEECFDELTPHIHAIETGLSSDPAMNRRLSALDRITLISNSDAHSAAKIGREANMFDTDVSYLSIVNALRTRKGLLGTIEFFPEEGKYHYDGHRACNVRLSPRETRGRNYLCPVCGKKLTIGVMHRVEKLADRENGALAPGALPFRSVIPLQEILAEALEVGVSSKKVEREHLSLLAQLGNEFTVLLDAPLNDIQRAGSPRISEAIGRMRAGQVHIEPGYDGAYGTIAIFGETEKKEIKGQMPLL